MITTDPVPASRRTALRVGSGVLALVLSSVSVSSAQQANPPGQAQPAPAAPAQAAPAQAPQAAPAQAPIPPAAQPAPAPRPAPAAPATTAGPVTPRQPGAQESTRATSETEAAAQAMQAELEPTPGGMTAEEAVKLALENSPNLRKSELELNKADANRARAKLAFVPRIDVSFGYTRLQRIKLPPFDISGSFPPEWIAALPPLDPNRPPAESPFNPILDQWALVVRATMPVTDIFLSVIPTYKGVNKLAKVAEHQRDAQKLQVSYETRVAFYDYARLRGNAAVARASVRVREAGVRDLESLVQAGTATQTELVRARGELENARAVEIQAVGGVDVARERLSQLMGVAVDPNRGIGEPFVNIDVGTTPPLEEVTREARQARPELLAIDNLVQARKLLLKGRKGAMYPKLQAGFGNTYANPNQRFIPPIKEWRNTWDVGASIAWSPNDTAYAYTQAQDAETDLKSVFEDKRLLEQGIAIESAAAVTGHRTAVQTIEAKTQQLEAARRYEADQRALLLAGAATPNDLLLAQRDLLAASLDWVNAFIAGRVAQAALLKAQGKTGLASGSP